VLGADYAQQIKTEILFNSKYENRDYHLAQLHGIRLAVACESEKRRTLATAFIKQATGGENLSGRRPFEMPISFPPAFKLWFGTNHLPRIDDTTISIWRRIHPLPFEASFEGEREVKGYEEKLLEERSGILRSMVDGCVKWMKAGKLNPPDVVRMKMKSYRQDEDVLGSFITDECVIGQELSGGASALYDAYEAWCKKQGEKAETPTAFGRALTEKGYTADRQRGVRVRLGLRLKTFEERQAGDD
jgi:putative DNA primase/helicase